MARLAAARAGTIEPKPVMHRTRYLLIAALVLPAATGTAAEIRVAVASNFRPAMLELVKRFEERTRHEVVLISGSTGKQYAQIRHGAPFDAFFAADSERPARLELEGLAVPGSRFTYAIGKLVLWSPEPGYIDPQGLVLEKNDFEHLAIANPELAPYGLAAQQVLQSRGVWDLLQGRLVRGEDIGQAFQFVASGNAKLGFVAYAQVKKPGKFPDGSWWDVPQALYDPIEQQAVLLRDNGPGRDFLQFIRSAEAMKIIEDCGYSLP